MTFLRDPLERALSEYVHRQKTKGCCSATWDFGPPTQSDFNRKLLMTNKRNLTVF